MKINIQATEWVHPHNYDDKSEFRCHLCGGGLTVGEYDCIGACSSCYEEELNMQNIIGRTGLKTKTLQEEIVDVLQTEYQREYTRWIELLGHDRAIKKAERFGDLAAKVESARCEECSVKDELLNSAEREARSLAISLWKQYYQKESPNFELCDSTAGIITQINNMVAGIIEGYTNQQTLLKEMAEALEEVVRCLSHGLQDSRASIAAKDMLQKYHEQIRELK